ncbi:hypothetical protein [Actinomadura rubrisoli]|nr:hypothetical protein [Actinomadura rubrisoli]
MDRPGPVLAPPADEPPLITEPLTAEECDRHLAQAGDSLADIWADVDRARDLLGMDAADDRPAATSDDGRPVDDALGIDLPKGMVYGCVTVLVGSVGVLILIAIAGVVVLMVVDYSLHSESKTMTPDWAVTGTRPSQVPAPKGKQNQVKGTALAYRLAAGQTVTTSFALPGLERVWVPPRSRYFTGFLDFRPDSRCAARSRLVWTLGAKGGRLALGKEAAVNDMEVSDTLVLSVRLDAPASCGGTLRLAYPHIRNYGVWRGPIA